MNYYSINRDEIIAQFLYDRCVYTFNGTLEYELMQNIVEKTIESNF